jgi:hypothetical protein
MFTFRGSKLSGWDKENSVACHHAKNRGIRFGPSRDRSYSAIVPLCKDATVV